MIFLLLGCTAGPADTGEAAPLCESATTWENFADGFFRSYCRSCHSAATPERYGAPESVNFDTEAEARVLDEAVRRSVLEYETMPPGGGLLPDDLVLLDEWLDCGG